MGWPPGHALYTSVMAWCLWQRDMRGALAVAHGLGRVDLEAVDQEDKPVQRDLSRRWTHDGRPVGHMGTGAGGGMTDALRLNSPEMRTVWRPDELFATGCDVHLEQLERTGFCLILDARR